MNVKLIRVVTGEEVIAEVLSETDDTITVRTVLWFFQCSECWICSMKHCYQ